MDTFFWHALVVRPLRRWWHRRAAAPSVWPDDTLHGADRAQWCASDWARVRAPARQRDQELSARARKWLAWLPDDVRPNALAVRYPRIANQLANCWRDVGVTEYVLGELTVDRRGDRQGFPAPVAHEIERLYAYHGLRTETRETAADHWVMSTQV